MESSPTPHQTTNDEIDLIEVIRHIWNGRWLIAKVTLAFMVLGLVIAFTTTEQYKAEARLLPEVNDSKGGASALLRQFGGLGGLNLPMGEGADAIRPELYPDVLKSTPFFTGLMEHKIQINNDGSKEEVSVFTYVEEQMSSSFWLIVSKYSIKLPWTIMGWIRGTEESEAPSETPGELQAMTNAQFEVLKTLNDRIEASIDQKSGVISLNAEFPDRLVAAQIAQYAVNYLTMYITEYRIQKAQKDMLFVEHRHNEKKQEFYAAQNALSRFRDSNRNIISATAQSEEQRLQDQYNLAFNIYNGLAQQLEQARIKVQEETPVIKVLEPVSVPVERSKPKRLLIIFGFTLLGGFLAVGFFYGKVIWENFYNQITDKNRNN
jgi:uncharacterized protein involved in exopolysaccharide biosynthesis